MKWYGIAFLVAVAVGVMFAYFTRDLHILDTLAAWWHSFTTWLSRIFTASPGTTFLGGGTTAADTGHSGGSAGTTQANNEADGGSINGTTYPGLSLGID